MVVPSGRIHTFEGFSEQTFQDSGHDHEVVGLDNRVVADSLGEVWWRKE